MMEVLGLTEAIDQLAMINSVHWFGPGLCRRMFMF